MRIILSRSGGFAAIGKRHEIDTAKLPSSERREIEQLVIRARAGAPPANFPDEFQYEMDVDGKKYPIDAELWSALVRIAVQ